MKEAISSIKECRIKEKILALISGTPFLISIYDLTNVTLENVKELFRRLNRLVLINKQSSLSKQSKSKIIWFHLFN